MKHNREVANAILADAILTNIPLNERSTARVEELTRDQSLIAVVFQALMSKFRLMDAADAAASLAEGKPCNPT